MNKCPTKQHLRWLLVALLTSIATTSIAQTQSTWQEDYQEFIREEDEDKEPDEELYEWLASFIDKPIDLNRAIPERSANRRHPFLSLSMSKHTLNSRVTSYSIAQQCLRTSTCAFH